MRGPSKGVREEVAHWSEGLRDQPDDEAEQGLVRLLDLILEEIERDIAEGEDPGEPDDGESEEDRLLTAVEEWASVASHAIANVYAPNSPFPRRLAGFGKGALKRLRRICRVLQGPLSSAQSALGAASYSISIEFPWGVSVSLTWP